ncbi:extracellular solute-binding protein [Edwardsiella piscicida]|uniref:extracellular solute-binding protein n=1 Tax=Edwardsiella piscicida TaxID=1263550 RepID=UPI0002C0DCA0|nr:extracellular solute-binding protein [Edwardsiella piscicida]AGH74302.1 Putative substrate-binding transport protein [Edwardsiella piscicida C07-087]EKS7780781.1 ABC transporter substrate-binding protein [Edwardsiella piscicida]EKS7784792.1 ABC transporter substrate-binding protein [Edwardsiella piscicida]ELM3657038.1 ABC transporter substrate-binding protein [Edwardsiella piscicida]UCQ23339.1 extracellular solute-binding protein [Edwardsiella piscicida]
MRLPALLGSILGLMLPLLCAAAQPDTIDERYAIALRGEAKYAAGFSHVDYANPAAPKGGTLRLAAIGSYDNFNPYAAYGTPAIRSARLFDTLFCPSADELDSAYPLIGASIRYDRRFRWAEVAINPDARFQDRTPIAARDVAFSFHALMTQGPAAFRQRFHGITLRPLSPLTIRIEQPFSDKARILALLTQLPILPQHAWHQRSLRHPLRQPPIGSGPYRIVRYRLGHSVTYQRLADYWAANLPINRGRYNLDTLHYTYYPSQRAAQAAFLHDRIDVWLETSPARWASQYPQRRVARGEIVKADLRSHAAQATRWLAFNNQLPLFRDRRVREAISLAFDFPTLNRRLYHGDYRRADSYFQNTPYAAHGYPSAAELLWLAPLKGEVPAAVFLHRYRPSGEHTLADLRRAQALLTQAGWRRHGPWLVNQVDGRRFVFTLLLPYGSRLHYVVPLRDSLARLGIDMQIRAAPRGQFSRLARRHAFGMIPLIYPATPFPSPALRVRWGSRYADGRGNIANVRDGAVDALLAHIAAQQRSPDALLALGRALDRVLTWNAFMLPLWYSDHRHLAYWNRFAMPAQRPRYGLGLDSWWYDVNRAARLPPQGSAGADDVTETRAPR